MRTVLSTALTVVLFAFIITPVNGQNYQLTEEQRAQISAMKSKSKLGFGLRELMDDPSQADRFIMKDGRLNFIATTNTTTDELLGQLVAAGAKDCVVLNNLVCGRISIDLILNLETLPALKLAMPEFKPKLNVGVVDSEGDRSMVTDSVRNILGFDGNGIKIGILSDSYNSLGGADGSVTEGDLPGIDNPNGFVDPVVVLKDIVGGSDEGRAMAELIHDVAPGAELFFYTAFDGIFDFANGIRSLDSAGCDIIVDDVSYFAESYFQEGAIGGAVNEVANNGVTYFSSAGNADRASYEDEYRSAGIPGLFGGEGMHDFGGGDIAHTFLIPDGANISLWIMWDDPAPAFDDKPNPAPQSDLDAYLFDATTFAFLTASTFDNIGGGFNIELIQYTNTTGADQTVDLLIERFTGPDPRRLKYIDRAENVVFIDTQGVNAGTCVGHSNVEGAIATGASAYFNTPEFNDFRISLGASPLDVAVINGFSSAGGTPLLLASDGTPIDPLITDNPYIVGPDGTNNSFFSADLPFAPDGFPNFFGTSASAPHVAAASALLLQANKSLTNDDVREALSNTAEDMDDPLTAGFDTGYDLKTGHGFINALGAMGEILDGCADAERVYSNHHHKYKGYYKRNLRIAEVGVYRAVQTNSFYGNILIQRNLEAGIDEYDSGDDDGWTTIGMTNGLGQDGRLISLKVEGGVPFVYVKSRGRRGVTKLTPESLAPREEGMRRYLKIAALKLKFRGCDDTSYEDSDPILVDINIYPNPTPDVVNIDGNMESKMTIYIFNWYGKRVFSGSFEPGEKATIPLAQHGKGRYSAVIYFDHGKIFKRHIIVE